MCFIIPPLRKKLDTSLVMFEIPFTVHLKSFNSYLNTVL